MSFFCLLNIIVETCHGSSALAKYSRTDSIFLNDGKIRRVPEGYRGLEKRLYQISINRVTFRSPGAL